MINKATRAAYGLHNMLDNTASATTINHLFSQLIEPIHLYGTEQWLPYYHPRKIHQHGPKGTFTTSPIQLPTEQVWKDLIYAHYSLHTSTPILADPNCLPLVAKAAIVQISLAQVNKFYWWNNTWCLLQPYNISETTISPNSTPLKIDLQSEYRRWWIDISYPHPRALNLIPSASSIRPSTPPHTSTMALTTSDRKHSDFAAPTTV